MKKLCIPPCKCNCPWQLGKRMKDDEYLNSTIELFKSQKGIKPIKEVVLMIGDSYNTNFFMKDLSVVTTNFPISYYAPILPSGRFGWYCKSAIINLEYVKGYTTKGIMEAEIPLLKTKSPIHRGCRCRFVRDFLKYGDR